MGVPRVLSVALLVIVCTSSLVVAAEPPHLAPDRNALWAHRAADSHHWMSTDPDEGDESNPGTGDPAPEHAWEIPLSPPLNHSVHLEEGGNVQFTVHIGGSEYAGVVLVSTWLMHGDAMVAEGEPVEHVVVPADASDGSYESLHWEVEVQHARLENGTDLVWFVAVEGAATGVFMGMSETRGKSHLILPVASVDTPEPATGNETQAVEREPTPLVPTFVLLGATALGILGMSRMRERSGPPGV